MSVEVDRTTAMGRPSSADLTPSGPALGIIFNF
jgi:hypothetical protein